MMKRAKNQLLVLAMFLPWISVAQLNISSLLEAGTGDAEKYLENYTAPLFEGFGYAMNGGWYNTGKVHELGGFDLTITGTVAFFPEKKQWWDFENEDFTNIELSQGSSASVPTILGPNVDPDELTEIRLFDEDREELIRLSPLTGLGLDQSEIPIVSSNVIPAPAIQLGVGLIKMTEVKIRWIPKIEAAGGDVKFNQFGLAVLHEMTSKALRKTEFPLDLSFLISYGRSFASVKIDEVKQQNITFATHGATTQFIVSKTLSFFTLYSGAGFSGTLTNFDVTGTFELSDAGSLTDPITVNTRGISPRINIGARILYAHTSLHVEYVLQEFPLLTTGFGISFR
jgi:hypothetical protein